MRGVRLLKGDETEWKTEGVAKQDGESRKFIKKKPENRLLPIFSPDFTFDDQIWLFCTESRFSQKTWYFA